MVQNCGWKHFLLCTRRLIFLFNSRFRLEITTIGVAHKAAKDFDKFIFQIQTARPAKNRTGGLYLEIYHVYSYSSPLISRSSQLATG